MSTSTTGRPSSSSRTVPPTTYASSPARISIACSTIDDHPPRPLGARPDADDELVGDRAGSARVLLREHAVPDQRHGRPRLDRPAQLDRERVHRDGAYDATARAVDEH